MPLVVRMDRRAEVEPDLRSELASLADSVSGLAVDFVDPELVESARDEGKFRDFVEIATVTHPDEAVLQWAAEELVTEFGWLVDVTMTPASLS